MTTLAVAEAGVITMHFDVTATRALEAVAGEQPVICN
jgi:hypothetical protein